MKIIILGSPGVGKGTYCKALVEELEILHISSGDMFRDNIKGNTELGKRAKEYIDQGLLVPDEVTIAMVEDRLTRDDTKKGFLLDGFPRTIPQAEAMSKFMEVDFVLNVKADHDVIISRLGGRRICRKCGAIFHMKNIPPKVDGVCDKCGGELYQRDDDQPEAIEERLQVYEEKTAPLIGYYKEKGLLREVTVNEDFGNNRELIMERLLGVIKR